MQGWCSISAQLGAHFDFVPFVGDPRACRGDVAFPPTCGPTLILSPFLPSQHAWFGLGGAPLVAVAGN